MSAKPRAFFPYTSAIWRFFWPRKIIYILLIVIAAWQIENWRGRQRWNDVSAKIRATDGDLTATAGLPAPVPAAENATRHPVFASAFVPYDNEFGYMVSIGAPVEEATAGIPSELTSIDTETPEDVLAATASYGEFLVQVEEAFQRPHCFWFTYAPKPEDESGLDPIPIMGSVTSVLPRLLELGALRAEAHLALGDPTTASRETVALIDLVRSTGSGTSFVGMLVETALLQMLIPELVKLVAIPGWDDGSLVRIADAISDVRLLERIDLALRHERDAILQLNLDWARNPEKYPDPSPIGSVVDLARRAAPYMPMGWHHQNVSNLAQWWDEGGLAHYDSEAGRVDPGPHPEPWRTSLTPYNFVISSSVGWPTFRNIYRSGGTTQTFADLCRGLCAIERYRLENGHRPETLEHLVPRFIGELPVDPVTGAPPHYSNDDNSALTLASFNWDKSSDPANYSVIVSLPGTDKVPKFKTTAS